LLDNPDYLNVYGRLDIVAGHDGDWDKTYKDLENLFKKLSGTNYPDVNLVTEILGEAGIPFSEEAYKIFSLGADHSRVENFDFPFLNSVEKISYQTVNYLKEKYPNGLEDKIYEVKSINSMAFWRNDEPISTPYEHHVRQLTFYQMYHPVKKGSFLYIDRDTMSISEIPNVVKEKVVKEIYEWLRMMTYYYKNNIEPPMPELIIYDKTRERFTFNWEVERSQYKDKILKGVNQYVILKEIKEKNKNARRDKVIQSAVNGEDVRGTGKYKAALQFIKDGKTDEEIMKKSRLTEEELKILKENIKPI
jgi:hypothetical protein